MGRIASQEQPSETQRFGNETAQRRYGFLDRRPGLDAFGGAWIEPVTQLVPEPRIGPGFDPLAGWHLDIIAAANRRALRAQSETPLVMGIDQLVGHRFAVDQHAEPAKGIDALEGFERLLGHALARDAVIAVTTGNEVAIDPVRYPVLAIGDVRNAVEIVQLDIFGLVDGLGLPDRHEVAGDFGLAVNHDMAIDKRRKVDALALTVEAQLHTVMDQSFLMHPGAGLRPVHQVDAPLFEHAGANAAQNIVGALALENDGVDPGKFQQPAQHEASGTCSDNDNLATHMRPSSLPPECAFPIGA